MNIKSKIFVMLILVSGLYYNLSGQCLDKNRTFTGGEKLKYTVYYNLGFIWIELADIELNTEKINYKGKSCIKLTSTWKTRPRYSWIVKINDRFESIINKDSIIAYEYNENTNEGNKSYKVKYNLHYPENFLYSWIDIKGEKEKFDSIPINDCTFDMLTIMYFVRNIDYSKFKPNQKIEYSAILTDKIAKLETTYLGDENIKSSKKKEINCIKIRPSVLQTDIFKGGNDKLTAWFSRDNNQVPMQAKVELFIGNIKVILKNYNGLRYQAEY